MQTHVRWPWLHLLSSYRALYTKNKTSLTARPTADDDYVRRTWLITANERSRRYTVARKNVPLQLKTVQKRNNDFKCCLRIKVFDFQLQVYIDVIGDVAGQTLLHQ